MKNAQELNFLALQMRRKWGEDNYSPIDIFAIVNGWKDKKITLVRYPLTKNISGMCTKEGEDIIICINSTMSFGRQRFTLAHELYHAIYEKDIRQVICDTVVGRTRIDSEKEADQFASYILMPYEALQQYALNVKQWTIESIIEAEQFFQVSHQAMLYRLTADKIITIEEAEKYREQPVSRIAAKLGYSKDLYRASEQGKQYFTTGEYIRKVEELNTKDLISIGKREELLIDAYRADMVYDFDEGEEIPND